MTLTTFVVLHDPMDPGKVFHHCRALLGADERITWEHRPIRYGNGWIYLNNLGQGLPALLDVEYHPDGPLPVEDDGWRSRLTRPGLIEVGFDTAYGYRAKNGAGCGDLHAWLVRELGAWLDDLGIAWSWMVDTHGDWYEGLIGLEHAGDPDIGALRPVIREAPTRPPDEGRVG